MLASLSVDTGHYADLAKLLWKHGQGTVAHAIGWSDKPAQDDGATASPETLASDIEKLGAAYIKLGQIASTRQDVLPAEYCNALSKLQDDVDPVSAETIREVIREELGKPVDGLFGSFDDRPLATASLGQVHAATLLDGSPVVVKVQRPDVAGEAKEQLRSLNRLAAMVDKNTDVGREFRFSSLIGAVDYVLTAELDYRREAASLRKLADSLREFDQIVVPQPINELVSERVLVMDRLVGESFSDDGLGSVPTETRKSISDSLVRAYLKQILLDGLFHADPHPGNLLLLHDNRVGLIDGGMSVSMGATMRRQVARLLLSLAEGEGARAAATAIELGIREPDFDAERFRYEAARIVANLGFGSHERMSLGRLIVELLNVAGRNGLVLPFEIILLSKAFLQIEATLLALDPETSPDEVIKSFTIRLLADRATSQLSPGRLAAAALDAGEFSAELPSRLNTIVRRLADNEFHLDINAVDEQRLLTGIEKIANRITSGLIVAALIVGASLIMNIETSWTLFGYPAFALIIFVVAGTIGSYLVYKTLVSGKDAA